MTRPTSAPYVYAAVATEAHDGDSVRLLVDLGFCAAFEIPVRLLGVQAPEVGGPGVGTAERAAGLAARDRVRALLKLDPALLGIHGRPLLVETVKDRTEGRGRYLATIWLEEESLADILVREGHACRHDGDGKVPKWVAPGRWARADGVTIRADGGVL